jgi:hypothetical protein
MQVDASGISEAQASHFEIKDVFTDYRAKPFTEYLDRGWCLLEMFFGAYLPLSAGRAKLFGGKLQEVMVKELRRPHLLFGTREMELGKMPHIMRPLRGDEFEKYHPGRGDLTNPRDKVVIDAYVKELFNFNTQSKVPYGCMCVCRYVYVYTSNKGAILICNVHVCVF